jgi:hypothetical protein
MEEIQRQSGAGDTPLPCQYFDLIGGTSTGGLIAIMLGRLRMVFILLYVIIDLHRSRSKNVLRSIST